MISNEIVDILLEIKAQNSDNVLSILDVIQALEEANQYIDNSLLREEKQFIIKSDKYICEKIGYDYKKEKTVYSVTDINNNQNIVNIEVSNSGQINFKSIGEETEISKKTISEIITNNGELLELISLNAAVSFFTEKRKIIISKEPYVELIIGGNPQNKTVLMCKIECDMYQISNSNYEMLIADEIKEYLKNINLKERKIPILAYAFLKKENKRMYDKEIKRIMKSTYPYLTEERIKNLKYTYKIEKIKNATRGINVAAGIGGGVCIGIFGLSAIPFYVPAGLVVAITTGAVNSRMETNLERAGQKEILLDNAKKAIYKTIRTQADLEKKEIEKTFYLKNKNKYSARLMAEKLTPREMIQNVRDKLNIPAYYDAIVDQLDNICGMRRKLSKTYYDEELECYVTRNYIPRDVKEEPGYIETEYIETEIDEILYEKILSVIDEIDSLKYESLENLKNKSLLTMRRLMSYVPTSETMINIITYKKSIMINEKKLILPEIADLYLQCLILSKQKDENGLIYLFTLLPYDVKEIISRKMYNFVKSSNLLQEKFDSYKDDLHFLNTYVPVETECTMCSILHEIVDNNLEKDLLGYNPTQEKTKVKIKEQRK